MHLDRQATVRLATANLSRQIPKYSLRLLLFKRRAEILYKGWIYLMLVLSFLAVTVFSAWSQDNAPAYVIPINSNIDQGTSDLIGRTLKTARDGAVRGVVIQLNTNGGLLGPTQAIVDAMTETERAGLKVVVYVGPKGARAFSAGAFIAMASSFIAMDRGTVIGSATPILGSVDPSERAKITNGLASWMQSLSEVHNRNQTLARLFVKEGISVTAEEAVRLHIAEARASSAEEALSKAGLPSFPLSYHNADLRSGILSFLSDPVVVSLLSSMGGLLILLDLYHPTIIATALGVSLIAMSLYGLQILGLEPLIAALLVAGVGTILLELKKGHGLLAFTGVALALIAAAIMIYRQPLLPKAPELQIPSYVLGAAALAGAGIFGLYLHQIRGVLVRKRPIHDPALLVGMEGVARTELGLSKAGVVFVASDNWTAVADETIKAGEKIRIIQVEGLKIRVKKA